MKSPLSLKLTLMMGAASTLTSCSEPPQSFSSVADCIQYGKPEGLCRLAYEEALAEHVRTTPTFSSDVECLAKIDVEQCAPYEVRRNDGSMTQVFVPLMGGFLVSKAMEDRRQDEGIQSRSYAYNGGYYFGSPIYRSRQHPDGYWTSSELRDTHSASSRHPNAKTATTVRFGFGGKSGFGGG